MPRGKHKQMTVDATAKLLSRVQFGGAIGNGKELHYRLDVMLTRFKSVEFFVVDQSTDEIIRQSDRLSVAIDGLPFPAFPPSTDYPVVNRDQIWARLISKSSDRGWLLEDHQGNQWYADPDKCMVI